MKFNNVIRGAKREQNDEETIFAILDAGFLCHVSFTHQQQSMMIPTAYGRQGETLYIHGSSKNFMMNELCNGQRVCVAVTHLDGVVLARNLFHSSVNYRSVVLFGKAEKIEGFEEKEEALRIICDQIADGRSKEVSLGSMKDIEQTFVVKIAIETASAKVRTGGPMNDHDIECQAWSGHIPLRMIADKPILDPTLMEEKMPSDSVILFQQRYS